MQVLQILFVLVKALTACRKSHTVFPQRSTDAAPELPWKWQHPEVFPEILLHFNLERSVSCFGIAESANYVPQMWVFKGESAEN